MPLIFAAIIGYVYYADTGTINEISYVKPATPLFNELNPVLGIFISIPSIFFVFDGFYSTAGLQTEMKEPKKTSNAMLIGLLCVSTIDLLISISLMISGQGSLSGLSQ
ncbi:MAG: APC family permease [Mycoplasmoidaceae bacterium]|nr:APC family permease [Mycoplasmoidaceae bacterium]